MRAALASAAPVLNQLKRILQAKMCMRGVCRWRRLWALLMVRTPQMH